MTDPKKIKKTCNFMKTVIEKKNNRDTWHDTLALTQPRCFLLVNDLLEVSRSVFELWSYNLKGKSPHLGRSWQILGQTLKPPDWHFCLISSSVRPLTSCNRRVHTHSILMQHHANLGSSLHHQGPQTAKKSGSKGPLSLATQGFKVKAPLGLKQGQELLLLQAPHSN